MPLVGASFDPTLATVGEVADGARTDVDRGLTHAEAAARLEGDGPNALVGTPPPSLWSHIANQFRDPLVYLLLAALVISTVAWIAEGAHGTPFDVIVIAIVVIANAAIGVFEERRAEAAVAELQRLSAADAVVVRDGQQRTVAARDLVVGDVLVLREGDAVPADARVIAAGLEVAEAALTGESVPMAKTPDALGEPAPLGDRVNMVFAGTAVTRGAANAIVTATGMDTQTGHIATLLDETERDPSPLQREIAGLSKTLGITVIAIALVVMTALLLTSDVTSLSTLVTVLLLGVALAVAAVPEGLPAIMSMVLAIGVQRMARRNAIVKDLSSVETLGSATVICSDKTGTLTQNKMRVDAIATAAGIHALGDLDGAGEDALTEARVVLSGGAAASDAYLDDADDTQASGDPTEVAIVVAEAHYADPATRAQRFERLATIAFSSERKLMSVVAADQRDAGERVLLTKGAPDVLLERCTHMRAGSHEVPLDAAAHAAIEAQVEELSGRALRAIGVAYRRSGTDADAAALADQDNERDLVWAGMVGIIDPPRDEARQAIAEARQAGIRVVMITGDHPATAARIAADLGLADDAVAVALTGAELDELDDAEFASAVLTTDVFARVAPEHKLRIVDALQAHGEVVAMTGDGVNDAPALKSADIGVAMGRGGTAVAREAAHMVLADDNFATIVAAVREGRGILDNIRRFLRYLLVSNVGEVLLIFLGVVLAGALGIAGHGEAVAVPLLATQILLLNLVTDLGPALAIGTEHHAADLMNQPPRGMRQRLVDGRMWRGIFYGGGAMAVVSLFTFDLFLPGGFIEGDSDLTTARTAAFTVLVLTHLSNALSARSEHISLVVGLFTNRWLWAALAFGVGLQVATVHVPVMNEAFSTTPLSLQEWAVCAALSLFVPAAIELRKAWLRAADRR